MRVNVDGVAFGDPRFARLASLLGLADADHARGRMEWLWLACTTRGETSLPQWLVEQYLGDRGPSALVESELARWSSGRGDSRTRKLYIRGAEDRCLWVEDREQTSKAGKARARTAQRAGDGRFQPAGPSKNDRWSSESSASASAPTPSPAPTEEKNSGASVPEVRPPSGWAETKAVVDAVSEGNGTELREVSAHQHVIAAWSAKFKAKHDCEPTWGGKATKAVKLLLEKHPPAEIVRRMSISFEHPRPFPLQPWDFATFASRFDECAQIASSKPHEPPPRKLETL